VIIFSKSLHPGVLYNQHQQAIRRAEAEEILFELSQSDQASFNGNILVDAMWDNPNYWIRYALLRSAIGLSSGREVGVLGPYRAHYCRKTLNRLCIRNRLKITDFYGNVKAHRQEAEHLLASTRRPDDILDWQLPDEVPADLIYDGILKRQRTACVDLHDPKLLDYVTEALSAIRASQCLLKTDDFQLIVLSHGINFQLGSLAWIALKYNIPVILLYGDFGVSRFARLSKPMEIYDWTNRPTGVDILALSPERSQSLAEVGLAYLKKRLAGQTGDLGAQFAYKRPQERIDRNSLRTRFGWESSKPIIAVYASTWFDLPHAVGMTHFRDILDWIEATVGMAVQNTSVNWLFKAHPCDDWYGGITLKDLMPKISCSHIRLADKTWSGSALIDNVDGLVTYHGTAGLEFASMGKPVLLADRGYYHDVGFAKWPKSRREYLDALASEWWKGLDLEEVSRRSRIFAGWYFGRPAWQGNFLLEDDSAQWTIYEKVPNLISENEEVISREIKTIREWFHSGHPHYHTFKMSQSDQFIP
jgi:hypothetical protein